MRIGLIIFIVSVCFSGLCGADFTLLDASGGIWDSSGLLRLFLKEQTIQLPENFSFSVEHATELPEVFADNQAAVVCGGQELGKKLDLQYHPVGWVAVVAAVSRDCPLKDISIENLCRIYSGRAAVWSRFGGSELPIRRGGCAADTPAGRIFARKVMKQFESGKDDLNSQIAPGMVICASGKGGLALIQAVPGMIVFGGIELARLNNGSCTILKIDGVYPDDGNIAGGRYPLAVPLGVLSSRNAPAAVVAKIVEVMRSGLQNHMPGKAVKSEK